MTEPIDPFGGPDSDQLMASAANVKFGISFVGTSGPDLLLGRVVNVPLMYADPALGGNDFNRQAQILARDVDRLGVDIRSFRVPLKRSVEQVMIPSIRTNFEVGGRPRWQPLAQSTVESRGSAEPILIRTGRLQRTATQKNMWNYYSTGGTTTNAVEFDERELAKRVPYGIFHQYGAIQFKRDATSKQLLAMGFIPQASNWVLPARMFVTMRPEDQVLIHEVFYHWLSERVDYHYYGYGPKPGRT